MTEDYSYNEGTRAIIVTFYEGEDKIKCIELNIVDDDILEGNHEFTLRIIDDDGRNVLADPAISTITIIDNGESYINE